MEPGKVAVCIVTHNSAADVRGCLESVGALHYRPLELIVIDCASTDDSVAAVRRHQPPEVRLVHRVLEENVGFAGGMNGVKTRFATSTFALQISLKSQGAYTAARGSRWTGMPSRSTMPMRQLRKTTRSDEATPNPMMSGV